MVTLLHAADLHLGMRVTRFESSTADKIREARFTALDRIRRKAEELRVDLALIAGDLFDEGSVDNLTSRRAFEILDSFPAPVYVLPGNHDPLLSGGVWDRTPWEKKDGKRVRLLTARQPLEFNSDIMLYPCPVFRKTSTSDPTAWIREAPISDGRIRIGIAHGSLKTRDNLPVDDHLIARDAATALGLDYLALGHWHTRQTFPDRDGIARTAYSGVHEPMDFQGTDAPQSGWIPCGGVERQEFKDAGKGEILLVRIRGQRVPPVIEPIEVGQYHWLEESYTLANPQDLDHLIQIIATRDNAERRLLRIIVSGVLDAHTMLRLDALREVLKRYLYGVVIDADLHIRPTAEEMRSVAGTGVLGCVLEKLNEEARSGNPVVSQTAERAILLLYQLAQEARK